MILLLLSLILIISILVLIFTVPAYMDTFNKDSLICPPVCPENNDCICNCECNCTDPITPPPNTNKCVNSKDGDTFYIDDHTYITCKNKKDFIVSCPNGVFLSVDSGNYECLNTTCGSANYTDYFITSTFNYPIAATVCINGKPIEYSCSGSAKLETFNLAQAQSDIFVTDKPDFFNENITYLNKYIKYTSNEYNEVECVDIYNPATDIPSSFIIDPFIPASYNTYLPTDLYNYITLNGTPDNNYVSKFGQLYNNKTGQFIGDQALFYPITAANKIYKPSVTLSRIDAIADYCGYIMLEVRSIRLSPTTLFSRNPLFALMLFPYGNVYRMLMSNRLSTDIPLHHEQSFFIIDIDKTLVDPAFIQMTTPPTNMCDYLPPKPVNYKLIDTPVNATTGVLQYSVSPINWYGEFCEKDVLRPHWLLPLKIKTISDLQGHIKLAGVTDPDTDDYSKLSMLTSMKTIDYTIYPESTPQDFLDPIDARLLDYVNYQLDWMLTVAYQ